MELLQALLFLLLCALALGWLSRRINLAYPIAAIHAERAELIRVWESNQISDDVLHHFEIGVRPHFPHIETRAMACRLENGV